MSAAFFSKSGSSLSMEAQPVRLKAVTSPNPRNGHVIGAQLGRQATAAPLGGSILRVTTGPLQYARFEPCCIRAHFAPLMTGYQPSLVAVHAQDSEKREIVRDIMKDIGLEDISSVSEKSPDRRRSLLSVGCVKDASI